GGAGIVVVQPPLAGFLLGLGPLVGRCGVRGIAAHRVGGLISALHRGLLCWLLLPTGSIFRASAVRQRAKCSGGCGAGGGGFAVGCGGGVGDIRAGAGVLSWVVASLARSDVGGVVGQGEDELVR